jgi:hypothetical protein
MLISREHCSWRLERLLALGEDLSESCNMSYSAEESASGVEGGIARRI